MLKLIVAFSNFENAPKNMKECKLKLIPPTPPPQPQARFIGTNTPHILFLVEEQTEGDTNNSLFSDYSSSKERPKNEN